MTGECSNFSVFLKDILEAYKEKLSFLNEEIVSQNNLRAEMGGREETLLGMITDWEAKYARLESRYLYSLKDISSGKDKTGQWEMFSSVICRVFRFTAWFCP